MVAYLLARVNVTDPVQFVEYAKRSPATIAKFGGRYLVRGGAKVALEGPDDPQRTVILEFPDAERIKAWYRSPDYQAVRRLREGAATVQFLLLETFQPPPP